MTEGTFAAASGWYRLCAAGQAVRAIRLPQVRLTFILGACLTTVTLAVYALPIMQLAWTNPLWAIVAQIAIGDQIKAFVLLMAISIADGVADDGYPSRRAYGLAAVVGCIAGVVAMEAFTHAWAALFLLGPPPATRPWLQGEAARWFQPIFDLTNWLLVGSAAVFLYAGRRAALRTSARLQAAELERIRRSKLALESRLQAMQARVEPQFLFNTLVQVERLYQHAPELAIRVLDDLIAYLRAAMPLMRDTSSTLAQELELARSYLDILRVRRGERVAVAVDVPSGSTDIRMPPMMLLPLIDHVITRDTATGPEYAAFGIRAQVEGERLRVTFTAEKKRPGPERDDEDGLGTIRARLTALYDDHATLHLRRLDADSIEAVLDLPLEYAASTGKSR